MSVLVTRDELSLPDLEINDFLNYYLTPDFLGAVVAWDTVRATSPWLDGSVAVSRSRGVVAEKVGIECYGADGEEALDHAATLIAAFIQSNYELQIAFGGTTALSLACETADYQIVWSGPRLIEGQVQVMLNMPRQPVPLIGVI